MVKAVYMLIIYHYFWKYYGEWFLVSGPACKELTAATAKSLQLCPALCEPIDGSPPGSAVPGILQVRTLEWAVISFSNARKWKVKVKSLSHVRLLVTPWAAAHQAPPSMGFSRQEFWSGVPLPSPRILCSNGKWRLFKKIGQSPRYYQAKKSRWRHTAYYHLHKRRVELYLYIMY